MYANEMFNPKIIGLTGEYAELKQVWKNFFVHVLPAKGQSVEKGNDHSDHGDENYMVEHTAFFYLFNNIMKFKCGSVIGNGNKITSSIWLILLHGMIDILRSLLSDQSDPGMDPDPLIFGPPDLVLFSSDPDPICNNGYIS